MAPSLQGALAVLLGAALAALNGRRAFGVLQIVANVGASAAAAVFFGCCLYLDQANAWVGVSFPQAPAPAAQALLFWALVFLAREPLVFAAARSPEGRSPPGQLPGGPQGSQAAAGAPPTTGTWLPVAEPPALRKARRLLGRLGPLTSLPLLIWALVGPSLLTAPLLILALAQLHGLRAEPVAELGFAYAALACAAFSVGNVLPANVDLPAVTGLVRVGPKFFALAAAGMALFF